MDASPSDCSLERWRERGRIDGSAAKDKLRLGVESALLEFGRGFLENPANSDLRDALQTGKLTRQAYYEELLRLVYRLIFLFAAEDRGPPAYPERAGQCPKGLQARLLRRPPARAVHPEHLPRPASRCLGRPAGALRRPRQGRTASRLAALGGLFIPYRT